MKDYHIVYIFLAFVTVVNVWNVFVGVRMIYMMATNQPPPQSFWEFYGF